MEVVDQTAEAVLQDGNVEVDQQTNGLTGEAEIGQQLGIVDGQEFLDGLQFDHDTALDQQIDLQIRRHAMPAVLHRYRDLSLEPHPSQPELHPKALRVDALQQPRPDPPMDLDGASYDLLGDLILRPLRASASLR